MFHIPDLVLHYEKSIYSSSIGKRRGALCNDIGNFMAYHFYPIGHTTGWDTQGKIETSLKEIFLISKSH